jgi:hypothetical protein
MVRYDKESVDSINCNYGDFLINRMEVVSVRVTRVCNADTRFLVGMCV